MAPVLVRTLLETKQQVPEFLQEFMPEGEELENLQFPSELDDDMGGLDAGAWGDAGGGGEASAAGADTGNAWGGGAEASTAASGGWETGGASTGGGGW